jgi:hypothetical protein
MAKRKVSIRTWYRRFETELDAMAYRIGVQFPVTLGEVYDLYKKGLTPKAAARAMLAKKVL